MDAQHYKLNKIFLSWIGGSPEQSTLKRYFCSFNIIFAICSQFCLLILGVVAAWQDWDIVIECSSPIIIYLLGITKYINYLFNDRKFKKLFTQMKNSWRLATFDAQIQILTAYTNEGKKWTQIYAVTLYGATSIYMIMPVISSIVESLNANQTHIYGLPFHVEAVLDTEKYYFFILLHEYYTTFFLMSVPIATDSMLIVYVQHACGLFEAVGYQLKNVKWNKDIDINIFPLSENDEHYRMISDSIIKHKEVLQFVELLTSSYSICYLFLTVSSMIVITFSGVQIVNNFADHPVEAMRFLLTCTALTLHFLLLSLPGQRLIDHSTNMHKSIYAMNWYAISLRARRLLNLMLMRCRVPCQLTAGKMSVVSFRNFNEVMQACMSYFTVLSSVQ